jgi:hypothetical protein
MGKNFWRAADAPQFVGTPQTKTRPLTGQQQLTVILREPICLDSGPGLLHSSQGCQGFEVHPASESLQESGLPGVVWL